MELLDDHVLAQLTQDIGAETLPIILQSFIAETKTRLNDMKSLTENQDWVNLGKEAHTLKSTSGSFGLMPLHEMAKNLDQACRQNQSAQAQKIADEIIALGWESLAAIEAWLSRQTG